MGRTDFGGALALLRDGKRVSRHGWNGKGMWLVLVPGSTITVTVGRPLGDAAPELVGSDVRYRDHIDMKTVDGHIVCRGSHRRPTYSPWTGSRHR